MIIFNIIGFVMLLIGLGVPAVVGPALHSYSHDASQIAAGALMVAMDLAWRLGRKGEDIWQDVIVNPRRGGALFFLPVWLWGGLWLVLGAYRLAVANRLI
jgi:hypothetical protein